MQVLFTYCKKHLIVPKSTALENPTDCFGLAKIQTLDV